MRYTTLIQRLIYLTLCLLILSPIAVEALPATPAPELSCPVPTIAPLTQPAISTSTKSRASSDRIYFSSAAFVPPYYIPTCGVDCPILHIKCLTKEQIDKECGHDALICALKSTCTIYLKAEMCTSAGICSGKPSCDISDGDFRDKNQCQGQIPPTGKIDDCCSRRHEYGHICDALNGSRCDATSGCTESVAQQMEARCTNDSVNYYCGGTTPRWPAAKCKEACDDALFRAENKVWDACMCNESVQAGGDGISNKQCCWCMNECNDVTRIWGLLPDACKNLYGKPDNIKDRVKDLCNFEPSGGHGCSYYHPGISDKCSAPLTPAPTTTTTSSTTSPQTSPITAPYSY